MSVPYFSVVYHTIMLNFIDKILCQFESCFSRKASFRWFVTITIGFMLRSDKLGVTSVIRDLALSPDCYPSLIHFFRASSWSLDAIRLRWFSIVKNNFPLYKEGPFHVMVGDGVKQPKEGRRMPGVKKLFQESENSSKPEYIHGHMFGGLGILAGNPGDWACVAIHLKELFKSHKERFLETQMELYGKQETICYYSIDLLWGQKLYQELRFVLVEMNGVQSILASTSLELEPLSIIRLYSYRMRIECTFRELKQQIGAFCYHFWSKYMPKLSYYQKAGEPALWTG